MTFLHEDYTLLNLILGSKILDKDLVKFAQYDSLVLAQINNLVNKLTDRLHEQLITTVPDASLPEGEDGQIFTGQLFLQDLVDMDSFVAYLVQNVTKVNRIPVITKQPSLGASKEYLQYGEYHIYKDGLLHIMEYVKNFAAQSGKLLTVKTVDRLIAEINSKLPAVHISPVEQSGGAGYDDAVDAAAKAVKRYQSAVESAGLISNKTTSPAVGGATDKADKAKADKAKSDASLQASLQGIKANPPLDPSSLSISPLHMHDFILNMYNILSAGSASRSTLPEPQLTDPWLKPSTASLQRFADDSTFLLQQFAQFKDAISGNFNAWQSFINDVATEHPNVRIFRDVVTYNAARPWNSLEANFPGGAQDPSLPRGSAPRGHAIQAAARLRQMVDVIQASLVTIAQSPQLMNLLGKDFVSSQSAKARERSDELERIK